MKTYRLDFNGKPIIYVFDEDGTVSYTPTQGDTLQAFLKMMLLVKQSLSRQQGVQMSYVTSGNQMLTMMHNIAMCQSSVQLEQYLKKFRDMFRDHGLSLYCANGILHSQYSSPLRVTRAVAERELSKMKY